MIFVYTTCSSKKEAEEIAQALISEKLASCANFWLCDSMYSGEEPAKKVRECLLLLKTEDTLYGLIRERIIELHSYELPVVACVATEFNPRYATWMQKHLR